MKSKLKFLFPLFVIALISVIISTSKVSNQNIKYNSFVELKDRIILSENMSKLIHSLQKERGMSAGYISNKGTKFKINLQTQRLVSDNQIKKLLKKLKIYQFKMHKEILVLLEPLLKMRINIDELDMDTLDAIKLYNKINNSLLHHIKMISKLSKIPNISKSMSGYINFLYAKENIGIQRAIGTIILSAKDIQHDKFIKFSQVVSVQTLFINNFLEFTSKNDTDKYKDSIKSKNIEEVTRMENIILNFTNNEYKNIESTYWFDQITLKINKLKVFEDYLTHNIINNIQNKLNDAYRYYIIFSIWNIVSILGLSILVIFVYLEMKKQKQLKDLTDKYIINSTTDTKGRIIYASEAFCKISGYSEAELLGQHHNITRHPDMPKSAFKDMWATISSGKPWTGRIKNLKKDGGYYWVYANIEPMYDSKGNIESYVAIRLDITNSKLLEEEIEEELEKSKHKDRQLLQQSRLAQMGEMLSMIAHQWRQPLAAISSTSSGIQLKAQLNKLDNNTAEELSKKISGYAQHLSSTIDDFRDFFKSNKEIKETNYTELIESVLNIVEVSLNSQNIKIIKDFQCHDNFKSYPNELKQVIINLIKNSEDALMDNKIQNPYMQISTFNTNDILVLEVKDNAGGIPEDIIDKIFDPYFSTKTKKDGTGLGLYMSKTIIEDHCGGKLSVSNDNDGAVFKIELGVNNG